MSTHTFRMAPLAIAPLAIAPLAIVPFAFAGALAVAAGLAATPGAARAGDAATTLKPFDEAAKDPSFERFRERLKKIVARRDLRALRRHLHPQVRMSLGERAGVAAAMRIMRRDPERWAILARLLRRGGKFTMVGTNEGRKRMFFAPYTYFAQLPDGTGAYDVVTITGSRVAVRARPSRTAPVLGRLSHRVVRVHWVQGRPVRTGDWYRITMPDGRTGYVPSRYAKSPVDYRAGFVKHEGRWTLYAALAGD